MPKRTNYPALTGARAIAAGLVFLHHFTPDASLIGDWAHTTLTEGHIGVTLFFVLSGFLIAYNYCDDFERPSPKVWFDYLRNRFARVYPLFFILTVATLMFDVSMGAQITPFVWIVNITMLKACFDDYKFTGVGPGWSLTVEEMFYWSAPFLFGLLKRSFMLPVLVCYAAGAVLWAIGDHVQWHGFFNNIEFIRFFTYPGRAFEFWAGAGAALYLMRKAPAFKWRGWTYVGIAGIIACMYGLSLLKPYGGYEGPHFGVHSRYGSMLNNWVLPLFVAIFYLGLVLERTWVQWLLSTRLFLLLGRASYAFYLLQQSDWVEYLEYQWRINSPSGKFGFTLTLALLAYWFVEEPLQQFFRHFQWKGKASPPPPPAGVKKAKAA